MSTGTTITVRFVGHRTDMWAAFVSQDNGPEVRVSLDPARNGRRWGCSQCGRAAEPLCAHTDLADAANHLRSQHR